MNERPAAGRGARGDDREDVISTVPPATQNDSQAHPADAVESYLDALVTLCPGAPLVDELTADDLGKPRGTASIARAARAWLRDKQPDRMRERLELELAADDWLVRYRIREAGLDVHGRGDTDWPRVHEVVTARREYRERWGVPC